VPSANAPSATATSAVPKRHRTVLDAPETDEHLEDPRELVLRAGRFRERDVTEDAARSS